MATTVLMTAEDLAALPDDQRGELIDGVMLPMVPVSESQWDLVGRLIGVLQPFVAMNELGRIGPERGYRLLDDPDTVLAPDISFVAAGREQPGAPGVGYSPIAPDLAVEVTSPSNSHSEMLRKTDIYLNAGVRLVWIIDPATRMVTVHTPDRVGRTLTASDVLDGGDVLPGFTLPLADLFA